MPLRLHAAPGRGGLAVAVEAVVDRHHARPAARAAAAARSRGSRVHAAGGEAVFAVVGEPDGLVHRVHGHDGQHGAEGLLPHDPHRVVHARRAPWAGRTSRARGRAARRRGRFAPRATASWTCSSTTRRWRSSVSGPTSASPARVAHAEPRASPPRRLATKASATGCSTYTRSTEAQVWPAFTNAPHTIPRAARSRSASRHTTAGSLPPSSSSTGVRFRAAAAITLRPVATLPVKTILPTRGSSTRRARHRVVGGHHVHDAVRDRRPAGTARRCAGRRGWWRARASAPRCCRRPGRWPPRSGRSRTGSSRA